MNDHDLAPCPFCRNAVIWCTCGKCHRIECRHCRMQTEFDPPQEAEGNFAVSRAHAAVMWNQQVAYLSGPALQLQELRAKIPSSHEQLAAFIGTRFQLSETSAKNMADWRFLMSLTDLQESFHAAGLTPAH